MEPDNLSPPRAGSRNSPSSPGPRDLSKFAVDGGALPFCPGAIIHLAEWS